MGVTLDQLIEKLEELKYHPNNGITGETKVFHLNGWGTHEIGGVDIDTDCDYLRLTVT